MTTATETEVFYWGEIPVGATVITSFARKVEGRMVVQALVKNDTADMGYEATGIPLSDVQPGQAVYVAPPTGEGSLLIDTPWRLAEWTPQVQTEIRMAINRATASQPLRGTVPTLIEKDPVLASSLSDFPGDCFLAIVCKAPSVRQEPWIKVWRKWTDPDGKARTSLVSPDNVPPGAYVYVRADYQEHGEPITARSHVGRVFLPVRWEAYWLERIAWDATCRTPLQRRDVWGMRIDRLFLWINIAVLFCQGGIMLADGDKRSDPRQIAWTALVGTAAWSSRQRVAYNEWFLAERRR